MNEHVRVTETPSKAVLKQLKLEEKGNEKEKGNTNKILSIDLDATRQMWVDEGFEDIEPDFIQDEKGAPRFIKYITTKKKARQGGILMNIEKDDSGSPIYFVLKNPVNHISWCVQIKDIKELYTRVIPPKPAKEKLEKVVKIKVPKEKKPKKSKKDE